MNLKGIKYFENIGYKLKTQSNIWIIFEKPDPHPFLEEDGTLSHFYSNDTIIIYLKPQGLLKRKYIYNENDMIDSFYEASLNPLELEVCCRFIQENNLFK